MARVRERLSSLRETPATIAWARLDVALPSAEGRRIASLMPWATRVLVPGAGHFVPEDAPALVARIVLERLG